MDTRTAAEAANVTTSTIRTWCRHGVVAAVKIGRRWDIDEASLTHRIALSAKTPSLAVTDDTRRHALGVHGPADLLARAFNAKQQITITNGPYAGETVHLGRTAYLGAPRIGLDHVNQDGTAVYLIDTDMLYAGAPTLLDAYEEILAGGARALAEADRDERAYLNPRFV
jgi:hypothetical protein